VRGIERGPDLNLKDFRGGVKRTKLSLDDDLFILWLNVNCTYRAQLLQISSLSHAYKTSSRLPWV
jgi:hypothetical protein